MSMTMIALLILMIGTVMTLLIGLGVMIVGGETNRKYGNKLMFWRVTLQGAAVLLLGVLILSAA